MSDHSDCIGRVLSKKKAAGIPINDQAIAIANSECKGKSSKNAENELFHAIPIIYKILELE